jgi:tetratricopeptide (TPR) repeat protein
VSKILKNNYGLKIAGNIILLMFVCIIYSCKNDTKDTQSASSGDPALDKISEEISKNPQNASLYFQRAQLYYDKSIYDLSIADLKFALKIDSLNPDYYHLMADAFLDYGNAKEAMNAMTDVMAIYPERIPTLLKMAELKYILEDYDSSIMTINEIVRLDPQNAEAYFMLGLNFRALKDNTRSINAFRTAVEMDSKLTDAWISLGELHEEKKDPLALQYYESAILSDPKSMQAKHAKAFYLQNNGKINEALNIYNEIIREDKMYSDAFLNSGLLYLELDSLSRAYEQFDLLTSVSPTNYMGFYMRGVVNEKLKKTDAALRDYQSAYNLNNQDKKVQDALESLKNQ